MISNERIVKEVNDLMEELTLDNYSLEDYIEGRNTKNIGVENVQTGTENLQNSHEEQTDFNIKSYFINSIVYCNINEVNNITANGVNYDIKCNTFRVFKIYKACKRTEVIETSVSQVQSDVICVSDEEDMSNVPAQDENNIDSTEVLNNVNYIKTPRINIIFPGYNMSIFLGILRYAGIKTTGNDVLQIKNNKKIATKDDILTVLLPCGWLNDMIINCYINLLVKESKDKILAFDSYFFDDCVMTGYTKYLNNTFKNVKIFECSKIIIPVHLTNHWVLVVVKPQTRTIIYFDSLAYLNRFNLLSTKISFIVGFLNMIYRVQENNVPTFTWKIECGNSPFQNTKNDCGVFVCTNARYVLFNAQINYNYNDIELLRQRISFEIINDKMLPTL